MPISGAFSILWLENDGHRIFHPDSMIALSGWLPFGHGMDDTQGLLVELRMDGPDDLDIADAAVCLHDKRSDDGSLDIHLT